MTSLLDIAPASEKVQVGEHEVDCYGISAKGVAYLLGRFPDLQKMMQGEQVGTEQLVALAPDAVSAIIAAGTGCPGDKKAEQAAERLPVAVQLELLSAILRLTLPDGVRPFVDKLTALTAELDAVSGKVPDTSLPLQ